MAEETLAKRLSQALAARNMSPAELAARTKLNPGYLSRLLDGSRGDNIRKETRAKIAKALDLDGAWLFAGVGPSPFAASGPVLTPSGGLRRYPSKLAAATAMRGIYDVEAIDAMLTEEHGGVESDGTDPGEEFWVGRIRWWHQQRQAETRIAKGEDALSKQAPLQGRTKSKR
jgi:transcriptional regulator with XRE-family HTH domain